MEIHEKLKVIRRHLGLPQYAMGRKLGVAMVTYHLWEKGGMTPRFDRIATIEELYKQVLAEQKKEAA
jgi:DNA-binding XRE family transcriptional regulator